MSRPIHYIGADAIEGNKNDKSDEMCINKFGKEKNKGRPNKDIKIIAGKGEISVHKWFVISKENRTIGHGNRL